MKDAMTKHNHPNKMFEHYYSKQTIRFEITVAGAAATNVNLRALFDDDDSTNKLRPLRHQNLAPTVVVNVVVVVGGGGASNSAFDCDCDDVCGNSITTRIVDCFIVKTKTKIYK